jgi:hypothetical protein
MIELPLWRALALPLAAVVQLALVHGLVTVAFDPSRLWLTSFLTLAGISAVYVALWLATAPLEWLVLRALGAPSSFATPLKTAALSLAPLTLTGWVPLLGPFLAVPWMLGARVGLLRAMAPAKTLETIIAVAAPLLYLPLVLFAWRYDMRLR